MKEQHDILTGMLNCTEAASILLAMTTSLADENALKSCYRNKVTNLLLRNLAAMHLKANLEKNDTVNY